LNFTLFYHIKLQMSITMEKFICKRFVNKSCSSLLLFEEGGMNLKRLMQPQYSPTCPGQKSLLQHSCLQDTGRICCHREQQQLPPLCLSQQARI